MTCFSRFLPCLFLLSITLVSSNTPLEEFKNHFPNYELPIDENNNVDIKKLQKFAVRVHIDPIYRARMQGNLKTKILKAAVGLSTLVVGGAIAKGHTDRRRKENNAEAQQKFDEFMARGTRVKNMK